MAGSPPCETWRQQTPSRLANCVCELRLPTSSAHQVAVRRSVLPPVHSFSRPIILSRFMCHHCTITARARSPSTLCVPRRSPAPAPIRLFHLASAGCRVLKLSANAFVFPTSREETVLLLINRVINGPKGSTLSSFGTRHKLIFTFIQYPCQSSISAETIKVM